MSQIAHPNVLFLNLLQMFVFLYESLRVGVNLQTVAIFMAMLMHPLENMHITELKQVLINTGDDFQLVITDQIIKCGSQLEPCQVSFQQKASINVFF